MKVFVLGATGYIGGAVVQALVQAGHDVSGLTRSADSAERLRQRGVASHIGTLFDRHVIVDAARAVHWRKPSMTRPQGPLHAWRSGDVPRSMTPS